MSTLREKFKLKFIKKISQNIIILLPKDSNLNILKFDPFEGNIPNILTIGNIERHDETAAKYFLEFSVEIIPEYIPISIPVVGDYFTQQLWEYLFEHFNENVENQQIRVFYDEPVKFSISEDQIKNFIREHYPKHALRFDDGQIVMDESEKKLVHIRQLMRKIINMPISELEELNLSIGDNNVRSAD